MKKGIVQYFYVFLILSIGLFQCGTEKKEVLLRLKFNENQSLRWANTSKSHTEVFENDSLVLVENSIHEGESVEKVLTVIDENSARLRLTYYFEKKLPDKNDSSKTAMVKDSSIIEYIQDFHAVNIDIFPHDTNSIEKIEYVKRLYDQLAPRYPDEPVSIGYKWSNNIKVMLQGGEIKDAVSTYTIKGFVREAGYDCVIIESKGNTIVPFQAEYECGDGNGRVLETRIDKKKIHGIVYFAYKEGFIVKEDNSYELLSEGSKITADGETKIKTISKGSQSYHLLEASGI